MAPAGAITPEHYQAILSSLWKKDASGSCCQGGGERLPVVYGTKGGHPRQTMVLNCEAVTQVFREVLANVATRNGRLIDKTELKTTMNPCPVVSSNRPKLHFSVADV